MAKMLIVEDDEHLAEIMRDWLLVEGYAVDNAATFLEADANLQSQQYDLVLLDWDLPDGTGLDLCRKFRASGGTCPILMMTGRAELDDKETGLDAGVDDYLVKPFAVRELSARIRALLRRAQAVTSAVVQVGNVIAGKYRLEELIDQGGMALIFRATQIGMERTVVVKVAQAHLLGDDTALKRFQQECVAMARLNHGNIASAFDSGLVNGNQPYLVMEYVKGETLANRIIRNGPLPVPLALKILIQICSGLEAAHSAGIVHRDLKPENILLQTEDADPHWVKIVDFGLALFSDAGRRLTRADLLMGSAGYISPEQLRGLPLDERVDIYGLGVMLFEMLTGDLPFTADNPEALFVKQLHDKPPVLSSKVAEIAPGAVLDSIAARALEKERDKRYQTVNAMRRDLEHVLQKSKLVN